MPKTSQSKCYLVLALHDRSVGRIGIALVIAESLQRAGHDVVLAVHAENAAVVAECAFKVRTIASSLGPLAELALREMVRQDHVDRVILCDYYGTCNLLHRLGIHDLEFLFDRPVVSVDLWDFDRTGFDIDRLPGETSPLCLAPGSLCRERFMDQSLRMVPSPFAPFDGMTPRFNCAPHLSCAETHRLSRGRERLIVTTTSSWQQVGLQDEYLQRLSLMIPRLVASYLDRLGPHVRWLHIGPKPFDLAGAMVGRYEWFEQMPATNLDALLARSDLVISLNASANTTIRAVLIGVPVVLLQNSHEGTDEDLMPRVWTPTVTRWIETSRPVHRFRLWPLCYYDFLTPLVHSDSIFSVVTLVEILEENTFLHVCNRLLYDSNVCAEAAVKQEAFRMRLDRLPDAAKVIRNLLA